MYKGIFFALIACLIWGLIFVVPELMKTFSAIEIVIGRYTVYGVASLLFFLKAWKEGSCRYPLFVWGKALCLSLLSGYYLWVILGIRYTSPEICALVLGTAPITIAFYGNWIEKEGNLRRLLLPSLLILIGLVLVNFPHIMVTYSPLDYGIGLLCTLIALASWTLFVVYNSRFLKKNPQIRSNDWATMIGVATFFWVLVAGALGALLCRDQLDFGRYLTWDHEIQNFWIGCGLLGILCSWVGGTLWNKASVYLSVSLAGQLMIFETIFGILFVYGLNLEVPTLMELAGILLMLGAVVYGIRALEDFSEVKT